MPRDNAKRVVEGARNLSPYLGERMLPAELLGKSVVVRELLPQDLKLEMDRLTRKEMAPPPVSWQEWSARPTQDNWTTALESGGAQNCSGADQRG